MSRNVWLWIFGAFIAIDGFFLFTEHRAHAFGALPVILCVAVAVLVAVSSRQARKEARHES